VLLRCWSWQPFRLAFSSYEVSWAAQSYEVFVRPEGGSVAMRQNTGPHGFFFPFTPGVYIEGKGQPENSSWPFVQKYSQILLLLLSIFSSLGAGDGVLLVVLHIDGVLLGEECLHQISQQSSALTPDPYLKQ